MVLETKRRKHRVPVSTEEEILSLAQAVDETVWSPEYILPVSKWEYLRFTGLDATPTSRRVINDDWFEYRA